MARVSLPIDISASPYDPVLTVVALLDHAEADVWNRIGKRMDYDKTQFRVEYEGARIWADMAKSGEVPDTVGEQLDTLAGRHAELVAELIGLCGQDNTQRKQEISAAFDAVMTESKALFYGYLFNVAIAAETLAAQSQ
jgi:hypothetical protein